MMLDNIDRMSAQITALDGRIEEAIAPSPIGWPDWLTSRGRPVAAAELIGEIGVDMSPVPDRGASGVVGQVLPADPPVGRQVQTQGPRQRQPLAGRHPRADRVRPARTDTFLGTRYRRLARRRGKPKAIVALGNSVLTVVYHLLADPEASLRRPRARLPTNRGSTSNRRARNLATQLQAITGQKIVIRDGKAVIAEPAA